MCLYIYFGALFFFCHEKKPENIFFVINMWMHLLFFLSSLNSIKWTMTL